MVLPQIESTIYDYSLAAGVKGKWNDWNINLSNTLVKTILNLELPILLNAFFTAKFTNIFWKQGSLGFLQNTKSGLSEKI